MRTLRKVTPEQLVLIDKALQHLASARYLLKTAGARKAHEYVAAAYKSVEGAQRHARRAQHEGGAE